MPSSIRTFWPSRMTDPPPDTELLATDRDDHVGGAHHQRVARLTQAGGYGDIHPRVGVSPMPAGQKPDCHSPLGLGAPDTPPPSHRPVLHTPRRIRRPRDLARLPRRSHQWSAQTRLHRPLIHSSCLLDCSPPTRLRRAVCAKEQDPCRASVLQDAPELTLR
jgi:hypothetical protein